MMKRFMIILILILLSSFSYAYPFIISNEGTNHTKAKQLVYSIPEKYFKDVEINFIYSNPDYRNVVGVYYPYSKSIIIYYYKTDTAEKIKLILLHELKHHYCWINQMEINYGFGWQWIDGQPYWTHSGCFLNTPIDEEYGFVK